MPPKKAGTKRKVAQAKTKRATPDVSTTQQTFDQAFYSESSSSDDDAPSKRLTSRGQLRKRHNHKPKRPKLSLVEAPAISDNEALESDEDGIRKSSATNRFAAAKIVNGLDGPELKINLSDLFANGNISIQGLMNTLGPQFAILGNLSKPLSAKMVGLATFVGLPVEISTEIYRLIFVTQNKPINFTERSGFERSSQFLRVCRKVYEQGSSLLYGENAFHFARAHKTRGVYYEKVWKEVGYKDVRRFLKDIGPLNMAKIRYVSIGLEDAAPTFTPYLDFEARKYANDPILIEVITLFGKHTKLAKLIMAFNGRCSLTPKDYHFLKALCSIKCHQFVCQQYCLFKVKLDLLQKIEEMTKLTPVAVDEIDHSKKKAVPRMMYDR